jgi:hypothetical protein
MTKDASNSPDPELTAILLQLKQEREKLHSLRELHALKLTNNSHRNELDAIISQAQQVQGETIRLTLKVENLTGQVVDLESQVYTKLWDTNDGKDSSRQNLQ